ncbi:MAG: hypothetical protein AAGE52_31790 [Myxococcota bacterium]
MNLSPGRVLALSLATGSLFATTFGGAQGDAPDAADALTRALATAEPGAPGEPDELEAWGYVRTGKLIRAREAAAAIVARRPSSYIAHFVLGYAHHYAEANFPRALFHQNESLRLFEARFGPEPTPSQPWRWHARLLREIAATHGDLEHYEDRLAYLSRYNRLYDPDVVAEQAWALMKLGRFDDARAVAREGLESGDARELEVALNALCAIEFEAGNDGSSYTACRAALDYARSTAGDPNAVDLTNFAEAARAAFKLAEAERVLVEATTARAAWYGNPWLELAELYSRGARFPEALASLRRVPAYRSQRPPHVRDADRNESRRALAAFYLVVGRPEESMRITEKALVMPDRRAHNSRDPAQDRAVIALLDRRARFSVAEMGQEQSAALSLPTRLRARFDAWRLRFDGWLSGRQAARLLADDERLVGTFRIGTSRAAIVPPWIVGELVDITGAGVIGEAVGRARAVDAREGADAYYNAFQAEAALARGDEERAIELSERARASLGEGEALLRARAAAVQAEARYRQEGAEAATPAYEAALQRDPGVFRRLGWSVPIRVSHGGDEVASAIADGIERSPRFEIDGEGLRVEIRGDGTSAEVCLKGENSSVLGCGTARREAAQTTEDFAQAVLDAFHEAVFSPRIDLSQADIGSLDGSNRVARDPMDGIPVP